MLLLYLARPFWSSLAKTNCCRFESVLMLLGYGLFLVFQLVTHK